MEMYEGEMGKKVEISNPKIPSSDQKRKGLLSNMEKIGRIELFLSTLSQIGIVFIFLFEKLSKR